MRRTLLKLKILLYYLIFKYGRIFQSREALRVWQESKVKKHLARLRKNSPYLEMLWQKLPEPSWQLLPLMNKSIMMENFDTLNTVGIKKDEAFRVAIQAEATRDFSSTIGDITVGLSSGTSGHRGLFLASPNERAQHAGAILAKILPGTLFKPWKVAFFLRANSNLYSTSQSRMIQFQYFDLLDSLEKHESRLNQFQPDLLIGPPSLLRKLARRKDEGSLRIQPKKIVSVAEVLDPLDHKKISESFHQVVHQVYQCTEGFLGITCTEGTLHLNEDIVLVEPKWLDTQKSKFHPIITDFTRTSQPIVRYLLNDILTIKKTPCPCGSVFMALESIEGRADDCLEFESIKDSTPPVEVYPDFIRRCILFAASQISEYHVTQARAGELSIALQTASGVARSPLEIEITEAIKKLAQDQGFKMPTVHFHDRFPDLGIKKLRRIERLR